MFNQFRNNANYDNQQLNQMLEDAYNKNPRNPWFKKTDRNLKILLIFLLGIFPHVLLFIFFPSVKDVAYDAILVSRPGPAGNRMIVLNRNLALLVGLLAPVVVTFITYLLGKTKIRNIGIDVVPLVFAVSISMVSIYLISSIAILFRVLIMLAILLPALAFSQVFLMIFGTVKSLKEMQKQFKNASPEEKREAEEIQDLIAREMENFQRKMKNIRKNRKNNDFDNNDDNFTPPPKQSSNDSNMYSSDDTEVVEVDTENKK